MRRTILMLTVAALVAAMMMVSALPAWALNPQPIPPGRGALIERFPTGTQIVTTPSGNVLINDRFHPPSPCRVFCVPGGGID